MEKWKINQYWCNITALMMIAIILILMLSSCGVKRECPGETPWRWNKIQNLIYD